MEGDVQLLTLDSIQTELATGHVTLTADHVHLIGQSLSVQYQDAQVRGDEASLALVQDTWERVRALVQETPRLHAALAGAFALAQTFQQQRNAIAEDYDSLYRAVETQDGDHDLVGDLIQEVQSDTEQTVMEWQAETLLENLYFTAEIALGTRVDRATGAQLSTMLDWLLNGEAFEELGVTPDRAAALLALARTFAPEDAHD